MAIVDVAAASAAMSGQPLPTVQMFRALVDTGATGTCITPKTAAAVGLTPIGKTPVHGVAGVKYHNNYLFHIGFTTPLPGVPLTTPQPGVVQQVPMEISLFPVPIQGAEFSAAMGFDVLLGMDVISTGSLHIEGDGTFSWGW